MLRCKFCGHENADGSYFCVMCGSTLSAAEQTTSDDVKKASRPYNSPHDDNVDSSEPTYHSPSPEDAPSPQNDDLNKRVEHKSKKTSKAAPKTTKSQPASKARKTTSKAAPEANRSSRAISLIELLFLPLPKAAPEANGSSKGYYIAPEQTKQILISRIIIAVVAVILGLIWLISTIGGNIVGNSSSSFTEQTTATTPGELLKMGKTSSYLSGLDNYLDAEDYLKGVGFTSIIAQPLNDIFYGVYYKEYAVDHIEIDGVERFKTTDEFPSNASIVVYYHSYGYVESDASRTYVGEYFRDVVTRLHDRGFMKITLVQDHDLTGLAAFDGEVSSITIDGDSEFDEGSDYTADVPIVIHYHTY